MSLEATIAANTEAVRTLTDLLSRLGVSALAPRNEPPEPEAAVQTPAPQNPSPAAPEAAASPKSTPAATVAARPARTARTAEAEAVAAQPQKDAPSEQPPYEEVKKVLIRMTNTHGRNAVVDLLARYGVTSAKELKPDVYAAVIAEAA